MKTQLILFMLLINQFAITSAQKLEIYTGIINSYGIKVQNSRYIETSKQLLTNMQFPNIGYRIKYKTNPCTIINIGMEFLQIGGHNFDTTKLKDTDPSYLYFNEAVKFSQMRIPVVLGIKLFKGMNFEIGYSLTYSFRKNQSFVFLYGNDAISYYNKFSQNLISGFNYYLNRLNIRINYNFAITPFYDTGKRYDPFSRNNKYDREYGKLHFINLCLGYTLN